MSPQFVARRLAGVALLATLAVPGRSAFAESSPPIVTSFTPGCGPEGTPVYVLGANYVSGGTGVKFNGTAAGNVIVNTEGTALQAAVPSGATTGPINVRTEMGDINSTKSFIVTESLAPSIREFSPRQGPVGTKVRIYGLNLFGDMVVKFNGVSSTVLVKDPTRLVVEATVPTGATTGPISVTTYNGTATSTTPFTVGEEAGILGFTPDSGPVGKSVVISGKGFTGTTAVKFNSTLATEYRVNEAGTEIVAVVPAGATTGPISVQTPGKILTTTRNFTVTVPTTEGAKIFGHMPSLGTEGTNVYIVGRNLTGATAVKFNGLAATSFTVNAEGTAISAIAPGRGISGPISVQTPAGVLNSTGFFLFAPRFDGISPTSGPVGTVVTARVKNLRNPTLLKLNGKPVAFTIKNESEVAFVVPPGATTGKLEIITATGPASSVNPFTVATATAAP